MCWGMGSVWESDDTLSDGGEFYESSEFFKHHKPASTNDQIPVLPSTPVLLREHISILNKFFKCGWVV